MKKLIIAFLALTIVGAGCIGFGNKKSKEVEGDWSLAFDLPSDWVMVKPYKADQGVKPELEINRKDSEVYLQSTEKTIWDKEKAPEQEDLDNLGEIVVSDYIQIRASHLDTRRIVPSEAVDVGDGLLKLDPCEASNEEGCENDPMQYYIEIEGEKYNFKVFINDRELSEAETIIKTAQKVQVSE